MDAATLQFLLHQSFLARAADEEKAREEAEVKVLEDEVVDKERRLMEALVKVQDDVDEPHWTTFSGIEKAAVHWLVSIEKARKKKKERRRRRRRRLCRSS